MKINILGTKYTIETHKISEDSILRENQWSGYCSEEAKLIVVADMTEKQYIALNDAEAEEYRKKTLRHEIVHAFLNESGLSANASIPQGGWAKNEETVDWIAIQFPKMLKAFKKAGAL